MELYVINDSQSRLGKITQFFLRQAEPYTWRAKMNRAETMQSYFKNKFKVKVTFCTEKHKKSVQNVTFEFYF